MYLQPGVATRSNYELGAPSGVLLILNVATNDDNGPVAALERPLPLLGVQRLSTTFNTVQHPSTAFNVSNTSNVETR